MLWRSEFRNVLAHYLRKHIITLNEANDIFREAETLLDGNEFSVSSVDIMKLVNVSSCSAYDCEFVSLALDLGVPLVTEDKKLISAFPKCAIPIVELISGFR